MYLSRYLKRHFYIWLFCFDSKRLVNVSRKLTHKECETHVPVLRLLRVLAVFSASAGPLRSTSGALQLVWDGSDAPPRPRADGTVSGADVDSQGSQSVSWPAAIHSATLRGPGSGPVWLLTWQPSLTWLQLHRPQHGLRAGAGAAAAPRASPGRGGEGREGGGVVLSCVERVSLTQPANQRKQIPDTQWEEVSADIYSLF